MCVILCSTAAYSQFSANQFPAKKIKDMPNYKEYSDEIMYLVANRMGIRITNDIPKPKIITDREITIEEFGRLTGHLGAKAKCSYYFYKLNIILVSGDVNLSVLAHEFVHYFQVQYKKIDPEMILLGWDFLEPEALLIEDWFKRNFIEIK